LFGCGEHVVDVDGDDEEDAVLDLVVDARVAGRLGEAEAEEVGPQFLVPEVRGLAEAVERLDAEDDAVGGPSTPSGRFM
jgi:hypothetical protein